MYIELLVITIIITLLVIWFLWLKLSTKYHNWRYNEKNDRGKIGEEHRQELLKAGRSDPSAGITRTIGRSTKAIDYPTRQGKLERRELLQTTSPFIRGEEGNSSRESSESVTKPIRNPFRKRK